MERIERIVIAVLILSALAGMAISYYNKISQRQVKVIAVGHTEQNQKAGDIIKDRRIININTADKLTLTKLPGIGPKLAGDIIVYRRENGGFNSPEELLKVKGIGPKKYESIKNNIRVDE